MEELEQNQPESMWSWTAHHPRWQVFCNKEGALVIICGDDGAYTIEDSIRLVDQRGCELNFPQGRDFPQGRARTMGSLCSQSVIGSLLVVPSEKVKAQLLAMCARLHSLLTKTWLPSSQTVAMTLHLRQSSRQRMRC